MLGYVRVELIERASGRAASAFSGESCVLLRVSRIIPRIHDPSTPILQIQEIGCSSWL